MRYPRIMIAAPKSGSGKTTVVCGLLSALQKAGKHPCSFKCGPDYIDPMYHRNILKIPSGNLDTFFTDDQTTLRLFTEEYEGDLAVIEGVMGLYDGVGGIERMGSSYDLAHKLDCPIVLVIDAKGAGKSLLAQIKGFLDYDENDLIKAVILNKTSVEFGKILKPLIEKELGIKCLGTMPNASSLSLPERHLGLFLPDEIKNLQMRQEKLADLFAEHISLLECLKIAESAKEINTREISDEETNSKEKNLDFYHKSGNQTLKLGVARDEAFCFYYKENITLLEEAGVELVEFSPLRDETLPKNLSGLLLGGGYPENYLEELSKNHSMKESIRKALNKGMPILAECGGFLYLLDEIEEQHQKAYPMVGAMEGRAFWNGKLTRFGYVTIQDKEGMEIKGHEFHYYETNHNGEVCSATKPTGRKNWRCMHEINGGMVGFPHLYYPSNPEFVTRFVEAMKAYEKQ